MTAEQLQPKDEVSEIKTGTYIGPLKGSIWVTFTYSIHEITSTMQDRLAPIFDSMIESIFNKKSDGDDYDILDNKAWFVLGGTREEVDINKEEYHEEKYYGSEVAEDMVRTVFIPQFNNRLSEITNENEKTFYMGRLEKALTRFYTEKNDLSALHAEKKAVNPAPQFTSKSTPGNISVLHSILKNNPDVLDATLVSDGPQLERIKGMQNEFSDLGTIINTYEAPAIHRNRRRLFWNCLINQAATIIGDHPEVKQLIRG